MVALCSGLSWGPVTPVPGQSLDPDTPSRLIIEDEFLSTSQQCPKGHFSPPKVEQG